MDERAGLSPGVEPRGQKHVALVKRRQGSAEPSAIGFAPLAVSRQTFSAPATRNAFASASTLLPSVDTRGWPKTIMARLTRRAAGAMCDACAER